MMDSISGSDEYAIGGVEGLAGMLISSAGSSITVIYDLALDKWRLISRAGGVLKFADKSYNSVPGDKTLFVNSTTSAGDYTIQFGTGEDGQEVLIVMTGKTGTDGFAIGGIDQAATLDAVGDYIRVVYEAVTDVWYTLDNVSPKP